MSASERYVCAGGCGMSSENESGPWFSWSDHAQGYYCYDCYGKWAGDPDNDDDDDFDYDVRLKFGIRQADPSRMKPTEFVWRPWLVRGALNLMVGREDIGKSTFCCYIAAELSKGTLPGEFEGQPVSVLFVGADEDSWNRDTMPRLRAAGADFEHIFEFFDRGDDVFDVESGANELRGLLKGRKFGLIVFEHLMDVLPPLRNANDPAVMRKTLKPLRRMLRESDNTALGALHSNKAQAQSLREHTQGTVQYGAVARSSFLVADHPSEQGRRVVVLGKANYVAEDDRKALSFRIQHHRWNAEGLAFDVGRVVDVEEDGATMDDALGASRESARDRRRQDLRQAILEVLPVATSLRDGNWYPPPGALAPAAVAKAVGRTKGDGTVRRILDALDKEECAQEVDGKWFRLPGQDETAANSNGHGEYDAEQCVSVPVEEDDER